MPYPTCPPTRTLPALQLYNLFPSILDWVPGPHQRIFQNFGNLRKLIARSVRDHQATLDPSSPRDFIDCFLTKIAQVSPVWKSHLWPDLNASCLKLTGIPDGAGLGNFFREKLGHLAALGSFPGTPPIISSLSNC